MTSELIVTVGPPGAGKSTWADANLPPNCLRLERDRFREVMWGSRQAYQDDDFTEKSFVLGTTMFHAGKLWPRHRPIALTDTGVYWNSVKRFWQLRPKHRIVVFDTPDDVLWQRNETRPVDHRVPPDVLKLFIAAFRDPNAWWRKLPHERIPSHA